ncbi:MAG: hypothetical protein VR64_19800 [Desulfatitalea sp. BRH_c12]|nr:MAG: hypothetical protein VR64_19800 [Desulfatitalea sp. BRH_c12]
MDLAFKKIKYTWIGLLLAAAWIVMGCGSKLSQENYTKLKIGMRYAEVTEFLGAPDECDAAVGMKNCTWGGDKKNININFLGEKVVFFSGKGL